MIKILHVVPTLGYGGVAKVVCNYQKVIDNNCYVFDYITHGVVEDYHKGLLNRGSKIFYLDTLGKVGYRKYIQEIREKVKIGEYDIVHIHTGDITGLYALAYKKCGAKHIICHAHTTKFVSKSHAYFSHFLKWLSVKTSDTCIACGYDAGDFCFGKNKYTVLQNSIDYESFNNVTEKQIELVRAELGIPSNAKVVGHVGAFCAQKNQSFILDFFSIINRHRADVYLCLCGKGPDMESIKQYCKDKLLDDKVIFCGVRNDINVMMKLFDVFVLPSLHEGLPVVGIEAQTSGVPCVFSSEIDSRVDIGTGNSQMLPITDAEVWADAVLKLLNTSMRSDPKIVKSKLKECGYDIYDSVNVLTNIYDSIVKR